MLWSDQQLKKNNIVSYTHTYVRTFPDRQTDGEQRLNLNARRNERSTKHIFKHHLQKRRMTLPFNFRPFHFIIRGLSGYCRLPHIIFLLLATFASSSSLLLSSPSLGKAVHVVFGRGFAG